MEKTALITGASRGIGRETARLLAREGYSLVLNYYRSEAEALDLAEELKRMGTRVLALRADVADREQVDGMVRSALAAFGGIDVLVNNAAVSLWGQFQDVTEEEWDRLFAVNVKGVFHCCRAVLPAMLRAKRGKIVNISSVWGMTGASCEAAYSASKAAVIGLTRALAKELGPSGIRVNCVAPGVIDAGMSRNLSESALSALREETPLSMLGSPADVAGAVLYLASDSADFITGQVLSPNGGFVI
ncbi:elongation factor P 5-aminopentanone reductase [Papillibacter cinnamivorans]|uniref:3-oxoacyl-[acyl-carrier protein] reductase n=1 Tax=Papillibacter cinnamivorans DSM 12816 TaxID=1122930 RepID=A0A1W2A4N9_9FIRM|nr:SDR family oxidoreductase [Papillibacter cinnamivorans]SMC55381.1 3-oxoacyl-[acyl-carrier protein] reductase [Papillibacter cinnamivorans DSM 12816]